MGSSCLESQAQMSTGAWQVAERQGTSQVGPIMNWHAHSYLKGQLLQSCNQLGGCSCGNKASCQCLPLFKRRKNYNFFF